MGLPTAEQSTCSTVIMNNDEDDCFALLDQYLDTKVCGGVSNPAPTPESYDGGMTVSAACTTLAPCCATAWHTAQEQGACSALVTGGDPTACADSLHFYCSRPVTDAGCSPGNGKCTDSMLSPDVSPDVFPPSGDGSVGDETQPDEAGDGGWDFADGESSDGGPPSCVVEGVSGICIDTSECASLGGYHSTPGYCPGPAGEECCTPD
jgi:hypothetical protein